MSDNDGSVKDESKQEVERPEGSDGDAEPRELTDEDRAALAALDEKLEKFQAQKRWSDVIKTTLAKAELVVDPAEKVALFGDAGRLYLERSSNQAEAIKCFRKVLELDAGNLEAIERLKEMYEKRRDWERLVGVMRSECALLDPEDQAFRRVEIARLATERLRKPAVCIELWQDVIESEADNPEALDALSGLYERARQWDALAEVLERKSQQLTDSGELAQLLAKLGGVYGDKLKQDEGAVAAYQRLLDINPDDRRAQEQLKKRYVALEAWEELEAFYAATGKWDELIRTLERAAEAQDAEAGKRIDLLFRAARLWRDKKEKPDRAARAYEKVLALDASNLDAADELVPIYEQAGDAKKLVPVYQIRLKHLEDPVERVSLLRECGLMYEEKLRDPQSAFDSFIEAFVLDPSQEILREDLERMAAKVKDWDRVFDAYTKAIDSSSDPEEASDLRVYYGRMLAQAGHVEQAIEQFRAVYDERPEDRAAISALEDLYGQTENFTELLGVLQRRAEFEDDQDERRKLAYAIAALHHERLNNPDAAIDAYQAIPLNFGEQEIEAYQALDQLYAAQERWEDLARTLEHRIDLGPDGDDELAELKFRFANVGLEHLSQAPVALEQYREVLMIRPGHAGAVSALEGLLANPELGGSAAAILEPLYEERGDWENLVKALEVSLSATEEPAERLNTLTKIGELYAERVGDTNLAFEVYCRALREDPSNPGVGARLEELAKAQHRLGDMVKHLDDLARERSDAELSKSLWMKAAKLQDEEIGDVDAAVRLYLSALELDDADPEVLAALEELYHRSERWRDLLDILRRRASHAADSEQQSQVLSQMAFIYDEMLSDPEAAIRVYGEILENDPTSDNALRQLDSLYERQQMWAELADNVARQLTLVADEERRIGLMLKLGNLRESRMGAVESAVEIYREVLDNDPLQRDAMAALERILQDPAHQLQVVEILEPLYRDAGESHKLVGILQIQVTGSDSPDRRVDLLHQMAELYEVSLDDLQNAFTCYSRSLADDPSNPSTQEQLERIAAGAGAWDQLAQVYEQQVAAVEDTSLRAGLLAKAAEVREERVGDHVAAIALYQQVLELDDQNMEAATALERLYQGTEQYEELASILLVKAGLLDVPADRREYLFRAAALYDELLSRPQEAIHVYQRALEAEPDDHAALDKLIELHLRLQQWEEVLGVYRQKADVVDDLDQKKALYAHVGAVYEHELQNVEKAIETYQRVLEIDPEDAVAIGRLDALYLVSENWDELLSILDRESDLAPTAEAAIDFRYRIGELFELRLNDAFRAVECYRDILDMAPDHASTQAALERMIGAGQEVVPAAQVLEPIYRASGESAKLVNVLEVLISKEEDPLRKVELLHQVAELHEIHLGQPSAAFDAFARSLQYDNRNLSTLEALERFADSLAEWTQLGALYDHEIAKLREEDPDSAADLALRLARIFEVQLGDVDNAIARYRVVVEADPAQAESLAALDRLYEATSRWTELAEVLEREAEVAPSPDDALDLQYRLGRLQQVHLGDVSGAIAQFAAILNAAPDHVESVAALEGLFVNGVEIARVAEVLEPLYRMHEDWPKLVSVKEARLRFEWDAEERVAAMHRIAEIAEDQAGDAYTAFTWMQRALMEDPEHDHSCDEVERLASAVQGWGVLAHTYAGIAEASPSDEVRVAIGKRLARVLRVELNDVVQAEEAYRFVLPMATADREVLEELDAIYSEHGAGNALAQILRLRVESAEDTHERVEFSHRLGGVLYNQVGAIDDAVTVYTQILDELDTEHEETIKALENIYTVTEDWRQLYQAYDRELTVALGDSAQAEILGRMAYLASTRLEQPERAADLLKRVLDLLGEEPDALNALGNLYALQENWTDLVDVLEREVAVTDSDSHRIVLFQDLGNIWYEKLSRDRSALESWERVLDLDPSNAAALLSIARVHRSAESWSDLVDTLHRIVDAGRGNLDDASVEAVLMELGALYAGRMDQPADAIEQYRSALEVNYRNFAAMDALEQLHEAQEQWEEEIAVKEQRVAALEEPPLKIAVLLDIASIWEEKLEEADRGRSSLESVLELDSLHDFAFERLERLHREHSRFEELIDLFLGRVEASEDIDARVSLLRQVSEVYERDMGDKSQAFDALLLAWQQDFTNEQSAEGLERIAGLTQRWAEVLTTANAVLQELPAEEVEARNAICVKCARWYGKEGHPEYAIPYLQQVLAVDPVNRPAVAQMAELHRETQDFQTYGHLLGKLAEMTEDPAEKADVLVRIGELNEQQFGAPDQAVSHYSAALAEVSEHLGALRALERIYRGREQWTELVEVLGRKVSALDDRDAMLEAKLELAEAYEDRLGDFGKATKQYQAVLEEDEDSLRALKGLERLYAQQQSWQDLLAVLERQLEVVTNERDRVGLLIRLAAMWEEEFLKPEKAAERLEQVVDIDPDHSEALHGLARLYRQLQRWDALVRTFERHIEATPERGEKARLYAGIGEVYRDELKEPDEAIDAFLNVTAIEPDSVPALEALSQLYEGRQEYSMALDTMDRLTGLVDQPEARVNLLYRMGKLYEGELDDRVTAVDHFERAIDIDRTHLASLQAMRDIHMLEGDYNAASRVLQQAVEVEESDRKKAALLVELGRVFDANLDEHERAIECFEQAHSLDADNTDAALPLVDDYTKAERWQEVEPLLHILTRLCSRFPAEEQQRLWFMSGECADRLGNDEVAIKSYGQAFALDSQDIPSLSGLAAAHYRSKSWEEAFKHYQMLLVHHREALGSDETTDAFYRLGVIKREQGDRRKALNMFEKALEEDSIHRPTLEAMVELYRGNNEWEQVIHFKKRILDAVDDVVERFELYSEIGAIWQEKLENPAAAIEAFIEASALRPDDHKMLHKLLGLYQVTGQWEALVDVIDRVSELDDRPAVQAKNAYTIGVILRDELKDAGGALERFTQALDLDPLGQLKAFEAVNKILTVQKDWKNLERAYRKMLHRVTGKGDEALEYNLWHSLGVIYRDRQRNLEAAAEAFAMASRMQPGNMQEHQILAELYGRVPGRIQDAINEHQVLLRNDPYQADSYRELYKLYQGAGQYDRAFCVAAALSFLQKADAEHQQFYQQYKVEGPIRPKSRLTDELWVKELFHADEDLLVGKIFEAVTPAMLQWRKVSDRSLDLKKKQQIPDLMNTTVAFARSFGFITQVFGLVFTPRLFVCPDRPGGLEYGTTIPPATVCGSALLSGMSPVDVMFVIGRHLAYYRGEHYMRTMFQTKDELKLVLAASMRISGVEIPDPTVETTAKELMGRMQPVQLEVLKKIGKRFADAGARADIKKWMNAVEFSACRAGFLICNDLAIAARMIQALPPMGALEIGPKDRIHDLVLFSVSEPYFRLREALGIQIGG